MATLSLFDSKETNMMMIDSSQQSRTDENKNSSNNHNVTNNIMTIAEAVAKETLDRANNMTKCAVELPSDGARLEPTLTLATTTDHSQRTNTTKSRANRSKKMLVVDPDSGKKYRLTRDDHSLTDKELHVYHKRQQKARVEQSDCSYDELDEQTTATFQTYATGHTMETASALTEVSYARNKWGIFSNKAAEEARDDDDVVEVGHYKQLLVDMRDPALMPGDDTVANKGSLWLGCLSPNSIIERQMVQDPYRRIQMVIFPDQLKRSMEEAQETLFGMKLVQNSEDFQAHVSYVIKGSKAYKSGIRKGDVLSFAVALSNVDKEDNVMADKLIKRLESVGMRTSYRELYDIFLSKTTNCRPIGLVFRRQLKSSAPVTINSSCINDEFEWSTDFLQSLTIKCRELEFEQKVPFQKNQSFDSNVVPFVSSPGVSLELNSLASMIGNIADYIFRQDTEDDSPLSYHTLRSMIEQSLALAFVCQGSKPKNGSSKATGTGFVVVRSDDGSWSPPCFLTTMGNEIRETRSSKNVYLITICKKELLDKLISGAVVHVVAPKNKLADVLTLDSVIIGSKSGRFHTMSDLSMAIKTSESQNRGAYITSFEQRVGNEDIVNGQVSPPEQTVDFYGALQSLELPYSMHAHPVIPENIEPYYNSDWVELDQFISPRSGGMATILKYSSPEDRHEIDIFTRRFKYFLLDGVPVQILSSTNSDDNDERELRLNIDSPDSLSKSFLVLSRKRKPGIVGIAPKKNFSTSFDKITKLSRQPPAALNLDDEQKKRFFSIETDLSAGPVMMLTKNKRDSELLLSGLKLLLEREKILD